MGKSKTPVGLSAEAQRLWRSTVAEFQIDDGPSFALLENACRALDRLREAEAIVLKEGAVYLDRFQQPKAHPAGHRIDCESANMARALHELGLNLSPAQGGTQGPPDGV